MDSILNEENLKNSQEIHDKTDLPTDLFQSKICWQRFDTIWLDDDNNVISRQTRL
jgi:hypothetical protein